MAVFETWLRNDLKKPVKVKQLEGNLFSADNGGNLIGVEVMNNGQAASLSGGVTCYIIRADGETVIITGTLSGNRASVTLPASAYVVVGQISIVIKVGSTTVGACVGYVYKTTTDTIVDPGHVIPSLKELLAQIATMQQLNQTVTNQEAGRVSAESGRVSAESGRASAETARASAETARASAETARASAEIGRATAETARATAETARDTAETARASAETNRATAETGRVNAETARATAETARDTAETSRGTAEAARSAAETARATAETARDTAETARAAAETQRATDTAAAIAAAGTATTAASAAADMVAGITVAANGLAPGSAPTATVTIVDGHLHIVFGSVKGDPGKDFVIRKTFSSIAAMQAYDPDTDPSTKKVRENDFVMIDTGSVQDVDTGKLYCYEPTTVDVWRYIGDLSGSQGIKGETGTGIDHVTLNNDYTLTVYYDDGTSDTTASIRGATGATPNISIGTVTTLQPNQSAYVQLDQSSTPEAPVLNFGIPQGEPGQADNVFGSTVPMSPSDSTKVKDAIDGKLDANQGSANAGKAMGIDNTGAVVPVPYDNDEFTEAQLDTIFQSVFGGE